MTAAGTLLGLLLGVAGAVFDLLARVGHLLFNPLLALLDLLVDPILAPLNLPSFEMERLSGMPLDGIHFAIAIGIPLIATLGLILYARRDFARGREGWWPIL